MDAEEDLDHLIDQHISREHQFAPGKSCRNTLYILMEQKGETMDAIMDRSHRVVSGWSSMFPLNKPLTEVGQQYAVW